MLHRFEPSTDTWIAACARRSPAVPIVCAVILGILADSTEQLSFAIWWKATVVAISLFFVLQLFGLRRSSVPILLIACLCLGGTWHHWRWSCVGEDDVSMLA